MAGTRNAGALAERVKTSVRLPTCIVEDMDEIFRELGLTKNTVLTLATVDAVRKLIPLMRDKNKRKLMIQNLEKLFQNTIKDLKSAA